MPNSPKNTQDTYSLHSGRTIRHSPTNAATQMLHNETGRPSAMTETKRLPGTLPGSLEAYKHTAAYQYPSILIIER